MKNLIIMYLKSLFRNRSLLILSVIIPVVLYPLIYWGFTQYFMVKQGFEENQKIDLVLTQTGKNENTEKHLKNLTDSLSLLSQVNSIGNSKNEMSKNHIEIEISDYNSLPQYKVKIDSTNSMVLTSYKYIEPKLKSYFKTSLEEFKKTTGRSDNYFKAYKIESINVADDNEFMTKILAMLIPMFAIISVLTGVSAAAVEVTAGEREINAYETVFVTPLKRSAIHSSKIMATFIFGLFSGLINFFMLGSVMLQIMATIFKQLGKKGLDLDAGSIFSLDIVLLVLVTLIIVGLLGSMLFVTVSSFSPTKKEANIALTPFIAIMMYISFVVVIPAIKPTLLISLVPILNIAFSLKLIISRDWNMLFFMQSALFTLLHIGIVFKFLVPMLFTEDVIFGNTEGGFGKIFKSKFKKIKK